MIKEEKEDMFDLVMYETFNSLGIIDENELAHCKQLLARNLNSLKREWMKLPQAEIDEAVEEEFWAPLHSDIYDLLDKEKLGICAYD